MCAVYFIRIEQEDNDLFDSFGYYVYSIIKQKTIRYSRCTRA